MSDLRLGWYWRRLRRMSPPEVRRRIGQQGRQWVWRYSRLRDDRFLPLVVDRGPFPSPLSPQTAPSVPDAARLQLLDAADGLLVGEWDVLGVARRDLSSPDWFFDPVTGKRAPAKCYAFQINPRSEEETGNVKQVWEVSRHHHLTVLAAAWFLTNDDRYAECVARQLRSWWAENDFLSGVHWTSGIEVGLRLIAWSWIRRLLDGWSGRASLFEDNARAAQQLYWHQRYIAAFPSGGSSGNNHAIAEAAGQVVASCAFPWYPESERWRRTALALLERELERNTFPSGVNRELATDYHAFVTELAVIAGVEAELAGHPFAQPTWMQLCRMVDCAAGMVDERQRAPRQGDGDDGRALLLDSPDRNRWSSLLALGAGLFGCLSWWPAASEDVRSVLVTSLVGRKADGGSRPPSRPSHFPDAGLTLLRTAVSDGPEIWCRCDAGPHGFLSIAAHAHADALSVEVRHGGVDILADPGTYCYHGEPRWRSYFRSTVAHNTLELAGEDQSVSGGPFLWVRHASAKLVDVAVDEEQGIHSWSAEHYGYVRLDPPAVHSRTVHLDRRGQRLEIVDKVRTRGRHACRLAFHIGPTVMTTLSGSSASLQWSTNGVPAAASLQLPAVLRWEIHRGETDPPLGWYSPRFGCKEPTVTLLGTGWRACDDSELITVLQFDRAGIDRTTFEPSRGEGK